MSSGRSLPLTRVQAEYAAGANEAEAVSRAKASGELVKQKFIH
jgi:hypothetical protein